MEKRTIKLADISSCTGCAACADVCPKQCITLTTHDTLHYYPQINQDECIRCGKCMISCPDLNPVETAPDFSQHFYAAWHKDEQERALSTSGGAGAALAEYAVKNGWTICGSVFDDAWNLSHKTGSTLSFLSKLRQSKYLQSDTRGIIHEIEKILAAKDKVLFFGTPCQVAAVRKVIGNTNNLMTVEIICHGVNSPIVWKDYVKYLENKEQDNLAYYNFRDKSKGWERPKGGPNLTVAMKFGQKSKFIQRARYNLFHFWFGQHYILREACFNCKYRKENRVADIVIGDFWGIEKIMPNADIKKGVSAIITNNGKGENFIKSINCEIQEVDKLKALTQLKGYIERRCENARMQDITKMHGFQSEYLHTSFEDMAKNYAPPTKLSYFIDRVKCFLRING